MRISENFGHYVTFKIPNSSTNKIINRSNGRPFNDSESHNLRDDPVTSTEVIKSLREDKFKAEDPASEFSPNDSSSPSSYMMYVPVVDPNDLVWELYLSTKKVDKVS